VGNRKGGREEGKNAYRQGKGGREENRVSGKEEGRERGRKKMHIGSEVLC